jgi:dienelactone hydrolase
VRQVEADRGFLEPENGREAFPPDGGHRRPITGGMVIRAVAVAATLAAALSSLAVAPRYLRAAALVVNAAGIEGWPHDLAAWNATSFRTEALRLPSRHGVLQARLYRPARRARGALLLTPGVHAGGLDEPRLVDFAGHLASRRFAVLTVAMPDLRSYRITPRTTDMIEDSAAWLAGPSALGRDGRVGLVGISFAGGLSVVAAGRPALRDRVAFVLALGGHGDLGRTLRYLCTGVLADGTRRRPHDYGAAIALLAAADAMVPRAQVEPLRKGIVAFLDASALDGIDEAGARAAFDRARAMASYLAEPAATLLDQVNTRDVAALGTALLPHVSALPDDSSLSPERSSAPSAPVYLLHGADDDVIPPQESRFLARHLEGRTRVELLVTPLIRHADVDRRSGLGDIARLVGFWAGALDE